MFAVYKIFILKFLFFIVDKCNFICYIKHIKQRNENKKKQTERRETTENLSEPQYFKKGRMECEAFQDLNDLAAYYRRSGGGLTLSGGESLCQPEFARDLLRAAKERGINTALESMACAPFEVIEEILPYLDLYLMDMKHTNPAKHKEFTGRPNDLMMENARKVALSGKCKLIIRVPVIPTFNATVEEIQGIASFANTLPGVEQLHLLPYHRLGQDKYTGLGREYLMDGILPPTAEEMNTLKRAAEAVSSLHVQIGG